MQKTLEAMERKAPGIFGSKRAVAQGFEIQTMAQLLGLFCRLVADAFAEYESGVGAVAGEGGVTTLGDEISVSAGIYIETGGAG